MLTEKIVWETEDGEVGLTFSDSGDGFLRPVTVKDGKLVDGSLMSFFEL